MPTISTHISHSSASCEPLLSPIQPLHQRARKLAPWWPGIPKHHMERSAALTVRPCALEPPSSPPKKPQPSDRYKAASQLCHQIWICSFKNLKFMRRPLWSLYAGGWPGPGKPVPPWERERPAEPGQPHPSPGNLSHNHSLPRPLQGQPRPRCHGCLP